MSHPNASQQQGKRKPLFKPTLILHGGAGNIQRSRLPPDLYERYRVSLLTYLRSAADLLNGRSDGDGGSGRGAEDAGCSALDAAVHAVSLMEDDELFNCGRGSVFTTEGTIEMEASVMVSSVAGEDTDSIKRGAGVMMVKNVRHPIKLAREVLLRTGQDDSGDGGSMHCQLSGQYVERLAREWGLEFKPDEWFRTEKRWDEHRRGLSRRAGGIEARIDRDGVHDKGADKINMLEERYLSQGTVGCVCLDKWGNLAVATSTGGMTNKLPGRIGDTPTLGAGFWAESWIEDDRVKSQVGRPSYLQTALKAVSMRRSESPSVRRNRAVALSGTGNGDSFLRLAAARTTAAMCRFSSTSPSQRVSLADAVNTVAGPGGELQRSAGPRWERTGEGEGGIIGIEVGLDAEQEGNLTDVDKDQTVSKGDSEGRGQVVFDFNCGGMFRAWIEEDEDGVERERMMVFREEYQ